MPRRAVVIGSGPNGLVAAITLARAGVDVALHEAAPTVGGGLRSLELTLPGFVHDVCSAIHPFAHASPAMRELALPVEWIHPPAPAAHPLDDGSAVVLERGLDETAAGLGRDGDAYRRLVEPLVTSWAEIEPVLLAPLPLQPRRLTALARSLGPDGAVRAAGAGLADARSLAERLFAHERSRAWLAGIAAHSVLPLERRPSGGVGLVLAALAHVVGWPFPRGGAQALADALAAELVRLGGRIHTSSRVDVLPRADLVLADVPPRDFARLAGDRVPARYRSALARYRHAPGAFKLDWALAEPIPWRANECRRAATVHLGGSLPEIAASESAAWRGLHSERPYVILVQHTLFDPSRAPAGRHTAWAYCHVPHGSRVPMTAAIESQVERFAPGFRDVVLARSALAPPDLERENPNLVGGDVNGGAMDLAQLLFRPRPSLAPHRTPIRGVYLCSAATPPGGGVHGMCGYTAARLALSDLAGAGATTRRRPRSPIP